MDPIWRELPRELVYRICNYLGKLNRIHPTLKHDIEFQEHILLRIFRASARFFRWPWTDVYNSLAVYNLRCGNVPFLEEGWDAQTHAYSLWGNMTLAQREDFSKTWYKLVNVSQSYPSITF